MELPDFMNYGGKFSKRDFAEKISRIAKRAGAKLVYAALILYYTLQSDKVSKKDKAIIIGALGYMIHSRCHSHCRPYRRPGGAALCSEESLDRYRPRDSGEGQEAPLQVVR